MYDVNIIRWFQMSLQDVYIVGGHIRRGHMDKGNVFSVPSNEYAEFNMFLDPLAAKTVFDSQLNITLIPLGIQRRVGSFPRILERLQETKTTPEAKFTRRLLSRLHRLQQKHIRYQHMVKFPCMILIVMVVFSKTHNSILMHVQCSTYQWRQKNLHSGWTYVRIRVWLLKWEFSILLVLGSVWDCVSGT